MKRTLLLLASAAVLLGTAGCALDDDDYHTHGRHGDWHHGHDRDGDRDHDHDGDRDHDNGGHHRDHGGY